LKGKLIEGQAACLVVDVHKMAFRPTTPGKHEVRMGRVR